MTCTISSSFSRSPPWSEQINRQLTLLCTANMFTLVHAQEPRAFSRDSFRLVCLETHSRFTLRHQISGPATSKCPRGTGVQDTARPINLPFVDSLEDVTLSGYIPITWSLRSKPKTRGHISSNLPARTDFPCFRARISHNNTTSHSHT